MAELLQRLGEQVGGWFHVLAGLLAFAEAAVMVGLVFPGEAALLVAGFAAQQGWIRLGPMLGAARRRAGAGRWFVVRARRCISTAHPTHQPDEPGDAQAGEVGASDRRADRG